MKPLAALVCSIALLTSVLADETEIFQDNFLRPQSDGYETTTLGEIYLALPQEFFELTYRERLDFLLRGWIQFNPEKKQIYVPGDGGQSRIIAVVQTQTKEKLILDVTLEFEGEKTYWLLERDGSKWVGKMKQK